MSKYRSPILTQNVKEEFEY
ncbi:MAG: hypothetical protein WHS64_03030 [Fervidobacterium sp.]